MSTPIPARTHSSIWPRAVLVGLAVTLPLLYAATTRHGPALADEFIYLAGARHLARTGSLDARFYDAYAILAQGHPHQDNHSPGYVLLLGGLTALVRGDYWTAVGLNLAAFWASLLLVYKLARGLGRTPQEAMLAAALLLLLPAFLPYVFWALAEVVVPALFLAALVAAASAGASVPRAILAGLLFGLSFLVRESTLFGLPAVLSLVRGRRATLACLATALAFGVLVYAPLSKNRSPGASNFWNPTYGKEFGFQVVQAARGGDVVAMLQLGTARARSNIGELAQASWTERGILACFVAIPVLAAARWRRLDSRERRFLVALALGWTGIAALMTFVYVVARWAGFRYILFLAPAFLPLLVGRHPPHRPARSWLAPMLALGALFAALNLGVHAILTSFKVSRQRRQEGLAAYVERYVDTRALRRIVLPSGWLFGLRHYPVEVISSVPDEGGPLRLLEQKIAFDFLVLPGESPLREEWDGRAKYRRLNTDDAEPPLLIYRRLK